MVYPLPNCIEQLCLLIFCLDHCWRGGGGGLAIGSELVAYMIIVFSLEMGTLIGIREIWHVDCELSLNADVGSQIIMPGTEHRFSRGGQVGATCGDSSKLSAMQIFKVDY